MCTVEESDNCVTEGVTYRVYTDKTYMQLIYNALI